MFRNHRVLAAIAATTIAAVSADAASAACTRLAFTVNDYGKVGPTNDAKNLLDKYIAKWASERNIKGYKVGPKDVTCELFLDVIVFDEYTCKAAATVCWNGPLPPGHQVEADASAPNVNKAAQSKAPRPAKAADGAAPGGTGPGGAAPIATGSVRAAPVAVPAAAKAPAPAAAPAAPAAAPAAPAAN